MSMFTDISCGSKDNEQECLANAKLVSLYEEFYFMSMFNDISCGGKGNEEEGVANAKVVSILAKKFGIGQWSFVGPGSEKKWYCISEDSPQGVWDNMAERMLLEFAESH